MKGTIDYGKLIVVKLLFWKVIPMLVGSLMKRISTSGLMFVYRGGVISWSSKKQTCIVDSTMSVEFIALASAANVPNWLRNLMFEIAYITSGSTYELHHGFGKAYFQLYNGKSRHNALRHNLVHITNGVITLDYVNTKFNLANYFTSS